VVHVVGYCLYGLLILAAAWQTYSYQKQRIVRIERRKGTKEELAQAKEIEKAYNELQTTQRQLIHREKMASSVNSLAGIAARNTKPAELSSIISQK
jgi:hypothetical protein